MRTSRHWLWWAAALVAAVTAGGFLLRDSLDRSQTASPAPPAVPVTTATVRSGDVPIELEALGRIAAFSTITVRSQTAGVVKAIGFEDGQYVHQGTLLAQIDPRPLQAGVDQGRANLQRDAATLANAQRDLQRYLPLVKRGIISAQQLDTQRSQVAQLHATVAADQAALGRDQVQLGYATVRAPISGILGLHLVDVGNLVNPSDASGIVALTQIQPIATLFALPQSDLDAVREQQTAGDGKLVVQAWTQDGSRMLDTGTLTALSNQVDPTSGTVTLKGVFPNANRTLWPGASITVRLVLRTQKDGLTVPDTAVDQGSSGPFVWVVARDGTAGTRPIKVRQSLRGVVLVSDGLSAGETVVTDGQYGLTEKARVAVQDTQREASAGRLRSNQPGRLGISP